MMNRVTGRRTWLTREAINFGAADVISHDAHFSTNLGIKEPPAVGFGDINQFCWFRTLRPPRPW